MSATVTPRGEDLADALFDACALIRAARDTLELWVSVGVVGEDQGRSLQRLLMVACRGVEEAASPLPDLVLSAKVNAT